MQITKDDAHRFTFDEYRKVGTTKLSREVLPTGTKVATLEGEYTCAEPSRLALDVQGNVYPVAESVFVRSYAKGDGGITSQKIADLLTDVAQSAPEAAYFLSCAMGPANAWLIDHPTIVVAEPIPGQQVLRCLGLLQGIAAMDGHKIVAVYGDGKDGDPVGLNRFSVVPLQSEPASEADAVSKPEGVT